MKDIDLGSALLEAEPLIGAAGTAVEPEAQVVIPLARVPRVAVRAAAPSLHRLLDAK